MEKIRQIICQLSEKMKPFAEKFQKVFSQVAGFLYKHKVITAIAAVLLFFVCSVVAIGNHYLNKINYVPLDQPTKIYTELETTQVRLGTGELVYINFSQINPDGSYTLADGRIYYGNGSVRNPDGSLVFMDGSYITADGLAVMSDGTTLYKDGTIVFQNGSYIAMSGMTVDAAGNVRFSDGSVLHISDFLIDMSGKVILKNGNPSVDIENNAPTDVAPSTTPPPIQITQPTQQDDDDTIIQSIKDKDTEVKDKLEQNDKLIEENAHNNEIWYSEDVFNVLLMGIDNGSRNFPYGRSDAMIVVSINKKTKKVKLVSFGRAAYVAIEGYPNTRLNHAHGYGGPALAIRTIEDNYKIRIDNYVSTTFSAFQELIDAIGGVDITLNSAEAKALKSKLVANGYKYNGKGVYRLNGPMALEYVRLRKIDSDRDRTQRQRNVLTAIANKAKDMNLFELNVLLNKVLPFITTDLSKMEIVSQLANAPSYISNGFEQHDLPHKSSALTLIDNYEVVLIDWSSEVAYTHKLFYKDVTPSYYTR